MMNWLCWLKNIHYQQKSSTAQRAQKRSQPYGASLPPPLSEAVKQRLLNSASNARTSNPERWIIAGLLFILTLTGGELLSIEAEACTAKTSTWPAVALQAEDRAIALHATKPGAMNQAHAEVVIRPDQGSNLLRVNHLPQAPQGRVYRLWALTPME